jgi:hypothetical protein
MLDGFGDDEAMDIGYAPISTGEQGLDLQPDATTQTG